MERKENIFDRRLQKRFDEAALTAASEQSLNSLMSAPVLDDMQDPAQTRQQLETLMQGIDGRRRPFAKALLRLQAEALLQHHTPIDAWKKRQKKLKKLTARQRKPEHKHDDCPLIEMLDLSVTQTLGA